MTAASAWSDGASARSSRLREAGDERGAQVELLEAEPPGAGRLRRQRRHDCERARERLGAEVDVEEIDGQEDREARDLEMARVGEEAQSARHRHDPYVLARHAPAAEASIGGN
jgi:hypothetical protein